MLACSPAVVLADDVRAEIAGKAERDRSGRRELLDNIESRIIGGEATKAVAWDLGVTPRTIRNWFAADGRRTPRGQARERTRAQRTDADQLRHRFVVQSQSVEEIASAIGATPADVRGALVEFGIARPHPNPQFRPEALRAAFASGESVKSIARTAGVDWLCQRFVVDGCSIGTIADELGASTASVRSALRRHQLARPSR